MTKEELGKTFKDEFYASSDDEIDKMVEIADKAVNDLWSKTYNFLYNHDKSLCEEWEKSIADEEATE